VELAGYAELLDDLKGQIRVAQVRAGLAVNRELVMLYWKIGREILTRQNTAGWGARVVDRLAADLRREFPEMRGLSRTKPCTCAASLKATLTRQLSNKLLDNCRGGITYCC
jgi:hypothetical protein